MFPDESSDWLIDYADQIPVIGTEIPSLEPVFQFDTNPIPYNAPDLSVGLSGSCGNSDSTKERGSRKRAHVESGPASDSKACREKKRRDMLNEKFQELNAILEPGRPLKMDKAAILNDAVRMVSQLKDESSKLKESLEDLQEKINELKTEKNELRDEKQRLKAEKEKVEQQLKAFSIPPPAYMPPPHSAYPVPFPPPAQAVGGKFVPFMGYPGVPMWHFTPPASVDTSHDHALRPPAA